MPMVCLVYGLVMLLVDWFIILQKKVLAALEDAGIFTSGGLIKDKVKKKFVFYFCTARWVFHIMENLP